MLKKTDSSETTTVPFRVDPKRRKSSEYDVRIGQRLRAARLARKLSQQTLAEKLGISFQQVQKYELGVNRVSGSRLITIGGLLGISVGHLLGEDSHAPVADDVMTALSCPGGHDLAAIFNKLPVDRRRLLIDVARAMAAG